MSAPESLDSLNLPSVVAAATISPRFLPFISVTKVSTLLSSLTLIATPLIDIAGVDYPDNERRFQLIYLFLSHEHNLRIKLLIHFNENQQINSVTKIFPSANWMEREVFDMYGIKFKNHPDLRRILTDYGFKGHPLRKDFPLTGFDEVRYSEKEKKVVYEPVKLEQNYRNFDFESPWEGTNYIKDIKKRELDDKKK
mgnify:CR=1 FL=1